MSIENVDAHRDIVTFRERNSAGSTVTVTVTRAELMTLISAMDAKKYDDCTCGKGHMSTIGHKPGCPFPRYE